MGFRLTGTAILDEPTLGLAPVILETLSKALDRLRETTKITVLLGEQNVTFALSHADRVYVLDHAKIVWEGPPSEKWRSALAFDEISGLVLDGIAAGQAPGADKAPAVLLNQVDDAVVRNCRAAQGTGTFLMLTGEGTRDILLERNDFRKARLPYSFTEGAKPQALKLGY